MKIISLGLANNKEYSFLCIGDSFVDKIHKFFLSLFGQKLNLLVLDDQNKCKVYTISKSQYMKTLQQVVVDSFTPGALTPKIIQHAVNGVLMQTRLREGIVLSNYLKQFTDKGNFNESIHELVKSKMFPPVGYRGVYHDIDIRFKELGLKTHRVQQNFLLEFAQHGPKAAETVLNYLQEIATWEKEQQKPSTWGEPGDPHIFIPSIEKAKILFGVKEFIEKKNKKDARSFVSILLEKIVIANPSLKEKIKDNFSLLSNFAKNIYTHSRESGWYDGDGPLRTNNWITYTVNEGLSGGYLDKTEFLS